jgi:hypothetical protein
VLTDARFTNMLVRLFQIRGDDRGTAMLRLCRSREATDKTLKGDAKTVYECPRERAVEIGDAMHMFYDNLPARLGMTEKYKLKEGVKVSGCICAYNTIPLYHYTTITL